MFVTNKFNEKHLVSSFRFQVSLNEKLNFNTQIEHET